MCDDFTTNFEKICGDVWNSHPSILPVPAIFYDKTIYENCDIKELCQDGFIDPSYIDVYDLPDELLFSWMREKLPGVEGAIDLGEPMIINGVKSTPYGVASQEADKMTVTLGALDVKHPSMVIEPDYGPALIVMNWYTQFCVNPETEFPYVPVANPVIPHVAKEQPASSDEIDEIMLKAGGLIFSPSYSFAENHDLSECVALNYENKVGMDLDLKKKIIGKKFIHTSRSNYIWHWESSYRVIALDFNPFHPMALPYIRSYEDDGEVIRGKYRWGRRERDFYFHRKSTRYRLHYESWGNVFGYKNHYMAMFDLVANFDLRELKIFNLPDRVFSFKPRFVVEGFFLREEPDPFFSNIYKERRGQREGIDAIYSYYSSTPIPINSMGKKYIDITDMYELRYYNQSKWELFVVSRATGRTVVTLIYTDRKNIQRQEDKRLYIQYSMRTAQLKVYVCEDLANVEEKDEKREREFLLFCDNCFFFGTPRNEGGSLIKNPSILSFCDYVRMTKTFPEANILAELMPDGDVAIEELLSGEELDKIRGMYEHEYLEDDLEEYEIGTF